MRWLGYDRSAALTTDEQDALEALGWEPRRWPHRWRDPGHGGWAALHRLVLPLATARGRLEVPEDNDFQRRSAADAVALACVFGFTELNLLGNVGRAAVARKVFGSARVGDAVGQVTSVLHGWGTARRRSRSAPRAWRVTRCC